MLRVVAALLCLTALAGCADEAAPEAEGLSVDDEAVVTDRTGAIRGVVVDETITPIQGARVAASCADETKTTAEDGAFAFGDLDPGTCFVEASKPGYGTVQASTDVEAGVERPPVLRIQMVRVPGLEPRAEVLQWQGHIECSVRFVVNALAACSVVSGLGDDFAVRYTDVALPTVAQSEMVWDSTQQLGNSLKVQYTDDSSGLDNFEVAQGPSPQTIRTDNATLENKHFDSVGLYVRVFTGDYEDTGLSLTLQQDFMVYTSLYYNYAPPEDWRFVDNSQLYPPPQ